MGFFGLAVKGLWCGAIYLAIAFMMAGIFPNNLLTEFAFQPVGIFATIMVFIFEIVFDFIKPPE